MPKKSLLGKRISFVAMLVITASITASITPAFALTELERISITDPRLENGFRAPIYDNVNVNQQVQISADITNHQTKTQDFIYIVQIKDANDLIVSLDWIGAQLTAEQKLSTSLSWIPEDLGEYSVEIFVWEGWNNQSALSEHAKLQIGVS